MCSFSSIFSQLVFQKIIISIFSFSKYNSVIFFLAKLDLGLFISFFFWFVCSSSSIRVMTGRKQQGGKKQRFWLSLQLLTFLWCCPLTPLFVWHAIFSLSLSLKQGSQMSEHVCQAAILHSCIIVTWHSIPDSSAEITFYRKLWLLDQFVLAESTCIFIYCTSLTIISSSNL